MRYHMKLLVAWAFLYIGRTDRGIVVFELVDCKPSVDEIISQVNVISTPWK